MSANTVTKYAVARDRTLISDPLHSTPESAAAELETVNADAARFKLPANTFRLVEVDVTTEISVPRAYKPAPDVVEDADAPEVES